MSFMDEIIFRPIIPMSTMIPFTIVMLVIVFLNRRHIINRIIILILLLIISQRPMLLNGEDLTYNLDLDILFVIDNTVSMNAVDVNNDMRINAVSRDCKYIMDSFPGSNFAIITFSNYAQVKVPFTNDAGLVNSVIDSLKVVEPTYANGSTLDLPYDYMKTLLSSSKEKEDHQRIVFFISDGELTSGDQDLTNLSKYNDIKELIDNGGVLGYGSVEGGKIKILDSINIKSITDSNGFLLDKSKSPYVAAISKMDENNLKNLAGSLSLEYFHMTNSNVLNNKIEEIRRGAVEKEEDTDYSNKDLYYYFSAGLLVVLLYELYYYRRREQ